MPDASQATAIRDGWFSSSLGKCNVQRSPGLNFNDNKDAAVNLTRKASFSELDGRIVYVDIIATCGQGVMGNTNFEILVVSDGTRESQKSSSSEHRKFQRACSISAKLFPLCPPLDINASRPTNTELM